MRRLMILLALAGTSVFVSGSSSAAAGPQNLGPHPARAVAVIFWPDGTVERVKLGTVIAPGKASVQHTFLGNLVNATIAARGAAENWVHAPGHVNAPRHLASAKRAADGEAAGCGWTTAVGWEPADYAWGDFNIACNAPVSIEGFAEYNENYGGFDTYQPFGGEGGASIFIPGSECNGFSFDATMQESFGLSYDGDSEQEYDAAEGSVC